MRLALALLLLVVAPAARASEVLAVRASRVVPVSGEPLDDGVVLVRDGLIEAVGRAGEVTIPAGATLVHEAGAWLVPGFIDLHAHVGGTDLNDMVLPVNTDLTVREQVVPGNEQLLDAQAGGVTTILFIPGSGTNLSGFGVLMKTAGETLDEVIVRDPGAMKIAQAGNPERWSGEIGSSRMGMNWNLRQALREGREYDRAWTAFETGASTRRPELVPRHERLRGLLQGRFPVLVHTQWFPVFQSSVRILQDEMKLWAVLSHAEFDSYENAPLLVPRGTFVNVGPRAYHQDYDDAHVVGLAAYYHEAGVERLSINTDSPVVPPEELVYQATMAVRMGLPWSIALRALTLEPARAIGLADRVGSLEPGKEADFALWTGDPLDPRQHVLVTFVRGRAVLDQRDAAARRW